MLAIDQAGKGPIVGLAGISGAFDLRPLLHTSINLDLMLSPDGRRRKPVAAAWAATRVSPVVPLLGLVGSEETTGFKQWTAGLVAARRAQEGAAIYRNRRLQPFHYIR